jgi:NAD(P)-dependent dehydrogenase (short-subunit alcohol dehydrogenase family)
MSPDPVTPGRFQGRVAFITGAGRGQGRSHALRLAAEGADVALVDLGGAGRVEHPSYDTASAEQLQAVAAEVRALGRQTKTFEVDVRDPDGLHAAADAAASYLGGIDLVVANAGITDRFYPSWELPVENWRTMLDINLSGVFYTCRATIPHLLHRPEHAAIVIVNSGVSIRAVPNLSHYVAAKTGLRGLAAALAAELGPHGIRCNSVFPAGVDTDMTTAMVELNGVRRSDLLSGFRDRQLIPHNVQISDITAAVTWLLSDEARFVTGLEMAVDAGETKK